MDIADVSGNKSIPVELNEKCPICEKALKTFYLNFEETLKMCPDINCSYPLMPEDSLEINKDPNITTQKSAMPSTKLDTSGCDDTALTNLLDFNLDDIILPPNEEEDVNCTDFNDILNDLLTSYELTNCNQEPNNVPRFL